MSDRINNNPRAEATTPASDLKKTAEFKVPSTLLRDSMPLSTEIALLVPIGGKAKEEIVLADDETILGRIQGATVELNDVSVSRRHARVLRRDDEYVLEDLGSSHGTYVDGVPIVSCLLRDGDIVQVGRSVFGFCRQVEYAPPSRTRAGQ
jgi:pSer/pThr/pTyr-binding forkhead associated (FHA) protein